MIGTLYIVSAPSGAGKTSLVRALVDTLPGIALSVSHTTRPRRAGETDGVDYHFVDADTFHRMVAADEFLEHAQVFGNAYGTALGPVAAQLREGVDVLLEIDWQGARQVRAAMPDAVSVFILPPSRAELERRLRDRGKDSEAVIARRLQEAVSEMSHHDEFEYLVINDCFTTALGALCAIVDARRHRYAAQAERYRATIAELLA